MTPIDSEHRAAAVGWHLIARGGDMTARVHSGMQLGVLRSGDLSFDAPNAVVRLGIEDEHLSIKVVSTDYELEIGDGQRLSELKVSPQTHICFDFLGHTLDVDNDFTMGSAPGDALDIRVVHLGGAKQVLGELMASPHSEAAHGEIRMAEPLVGRPLAAVPVDYLQREHLAARAEARTTAKSRLRIGKVIGVLAASGLVIFTLVLVALSVAERSSSVNETVPPPELEASGADSVAPPISVAAEAPAADAPATEAPAESVPAIGASALDDARVGPDVLARFEALLEVEPLPSKATIDFAMESLKSLMAAYPEDPNVADALSRLTERLVVEARVSYDQGEAFLAGRLIEQASTSGFAQAAVADTLAYFENFPPGSEVQGTGAEAPAVSEVSAPEESTVAASSAGSVQAASESSTAAAAASDRVEEEPAQAATRSVAEPGDELDMMVESATGLALGALAVEGAAAGSVPAGSVDALGPMAGTTQAGSSLDERMQITLDTYLESSAAAGASSANQLPEGFAVEDNAGASGWAEPEDVADQLAAPVADAQPLGPRFIEFSDLTVVRQVPLEYPSRALDGAEGSVDVAFTVTEAGRVDELSIEGDAPSIFLREAFRAVSQWRFRPVQVNGEAVPVRTALRITFKG